MVLTTTDVLQSTNLNLLSTVFFNINNEDENAYYIESYYLKSKHSNMNFSTELAQQNNKILSDFTGLDFKISNQTDNSIKHIAEIKINDTLSREEFLNRIYSNIEKLRFQIDPLNFNRIIILSFFVLRGSIDLSRSLFAVDILGKNISEKYINHLINILTSLQDIDQLNFNFRELQPQFYAEGVRRNTQLRINLKWFSDFYGELIKDVNIYKYDLIYINKVKFDHKNYNKGLSLGFIQRAYFYKQKILGNLNSLSYLSEDALKIEIKKLREELRLDKEEQNDSKVSRDSSVVQLAKIEQPDICFSCNNIYPLEDRTFTLRHSGKPYLEIHHVISFNSNSSYDVKDNLVKLCPACHRALTPNRADETYQKNIIMHILENNITANQYVSNFLQPTASETDKIDFVYSKLK